MTKLPFFMYANTSLKLIKKFALSIQLWLLNDSLLLDGGCLYVNKHDSEIWTPWSLLLTHLYVCTQKQNLLFLYQTCTFCYPFLKKKSLKSSLKRSKNKITKNLNMKNLEKYCLLQQLIYHKACLQRITMAVVLFLYTKKRSVKVNIT